MLASLAVLAGCSTPGTVTGTPSTTNPASPTTSARPPKLPAAPEPALTRDCPYLDAEFVAAANGQRVDRTQISRPAQGPHPSCFFFRPDGGLQLSVRVYVGEPAVAMGLVDQAAPIAESDPADQPSGWNGGSLVTGAGAVYAVAKDGAAVLVTTNQGQTIKARRVAERVIATLRP